MSDRIRSDHVQNRGVRRRVCVVGVTVEVESTHSLTGRRRVLPAPVLNRTCNAPMQLFFCFCFVRRQKCRNAMQLEICEKKNEKKKHSVFICDMSGDCMLACMSWVGVEHNRSCTLRGLME
jgi:hypothetical protein